MGAKPLPDDTLRDAWEAVNRVGATATAARELGIPTQTLQHRVHVAMERLSLPPPTNGTDPRWRVNEPLPSKDRSIEEILSHKRSLTTRVRAYEKGVKLVRIAISTPGPVGFFLMGDPHLDSDGCDIILLEEHLEIVKKRPKIIFPGNLGDVKDNWVGRLARLYAHHSITQSEGWRLAEWLFGFTPWCWLIKGNHDCWSGGNDPLDWITKETGVGVVREAGIRLQFDHPGGVSTRMHVRHDFPGHSMYNPIHALKRELLHGYRDHILAAGHRHVGADAGDIIADMSVQMVRVSGYKKSDEYAHLSGFHQRPIHPSALIIVDPGVPDNSRGRAFCAPTVEEGAEYLDWKRAKFEGSTSSAVVAKGAKNGRRKGSANRGKEKSR